MSSYVFREADRAVGPMAEPLGMLCDPRVVRRALEREVEGELHVVALQLREQVLEIVERPELRMDRGVPPGLRSDRPRTPGVVGSGRRGVVRALPAGAPDRVDRRQVQHVEPQLGDVGHEPGDVAERAVPRGIGRRRAREELVPGAVACPFAGGDHPELL